nr:zinc finger CCCH-type with G patch domain-containing protein-like [Lytechinus pictus]
MDEASLEATIDAYKTQLKQIESVLESGRSEGVDALRQLQQDLKDIIELTQGSLLSLRKSNLLSYVDDITGPPQAEEKTNNEAKDAGPLDMDEEFAAFQAEIAATSTSSSSLPVRSNQTPYEEDNNDDENSDEEEGENQDMNEYEDISGTTCSILYKPDWGAYQRHNAVVLSVEPSSPSDDEIKLRVLFCNPTNASMKPCPYYFKGECRFSEEDCKFSHGYIVNASELQAFQEIDLSQLSIEGRCLAKYSDDIWYPASIIDIDKDTKNVTVCFESYGDSITVGAENVLPIGSQTNYDEEEEEEDDNQSMDSDGDMPSTSASMSRLGDNEEEEEDVVPDILWKPSGPSCKLGEWETHTRGIASKLMAMMGYEIGKGLGKNGEGRTEPVEAVIVPAGKSLDTCMKLREMKKLGIVGKKKKKRGKGKNKKKKNGGGNSKLTKLKKPKDVFEFINTHLGAKKIKVNELLADNTVLVKTNRVHREESQGERKANTRQLNVQLLKTQEETRATEKRLTQLRQSLVRNQRDKTSCAAIQLKIQRAEDYLATLKSSQRKLERQKTSRDDHKKLTIF